MSLKMPISVTFHPFQALWNSNGQESVLEPDIWAKVPTAWEFYLPGIPSAQGRLQCRPEILHSSDKVWQNRYILYFTHTQLQIYSLIHTSPKREKRILEEHVFLQRHGRRTWRYYAFLSNIAELKFEKFFVMTWIKFLAPNASSMCGLESLDIWITMLGL